MKDFLEIFGNVISSIIFFIQSISILAIVLIVFTFAVYMLS